MLCGLHAPEPVVSVFVGLRGPLIVLPSGRPLAAGRELGIILLPYCSFLDAWNRLSREAEAHSDERGRKIATHVRALEYKAGLLTAYWRVAKSAKTNVSFRLGQWILSC